MSIETVVPEEENDPSSTGGSEKSKPSPAALSDETKTPDEIDIDIKEKQKEAKTKISFKNNDYLKKYVQVDKEVPGGNPKNTSSRDDIKKRLEGNDTNNQNTTSSTTADPDDDTDANAELIVEVIDWILTGIIGWFSLDKNDKDYETDNSKKKILKKYLSKWLAIKQKKYPIEFLLGMAFLSTYFVSARKAYLKRKQNKAEMEIKKANMMEEKKQKRKLKDAA